MNQSLQSRAESEMESTVMAMSQTASFGIVLSIGKSSIFKKIEN